MAYGKHILVGKITKVYGHDGTVTIRLEKYSSDDVQEMESVFVETDGRPVPFFIDYSEQPDPSTLRVKFTDYNTIEKVREFIGCKVYRTDPAIPGTISAEHDTLNGFEVFSEEDISLGFIDGITENPGQLLLNIKTVRGKNILLPLHEDLIREIDKERKMIHMVIPEGITDIN